MLGVGIVFLVARLEGVDVAKIKETALPGVGIRHEFTTKDGRIVGVISYRTGRHELFISDADDMDTPIERIDLEDEERQALTDILGASQIAASLSRLQQRVKELAIDWIPIDEGTPFAGRTIGDSQARARTGVSIVAVLRHGTAIAAPGPDEQLRAGDTLVVVGTPSGIRDLVELLGG